MKRLSIKLRITLWFTAFMLALTAVALTTLFALGERTALRGLKSELKDAAEDSLRELEFSDGTLEIDDDLDYFNDGTYLLVFDEAGHPLYGRLPKGLAPSLDFSHGQLQLYEGDGATWHVYDALYPVEGYGNVWVRAASSAADTESAFDMLGKLAFIGLPLLALLAAAGGYLLIDRGLRPVRRIIETAERIGDGKDLTRRIGLQGGTDEIHALAAAYDSMFDRLEASFEREKQFTADASHELRTPVAVILAQCENALDDPALPEDASAGFQAIQKQGRYMSALISQLLTLARADKGHLKLKEELLDLSELTELVVAEIQESADEKHLTVHVELEQGIKVCGDETMLMRLWLNLLENGVKYGKENGQLWVRLYLRDNRVFGEVQDDGPGVPPGELPQIWERFYRGRKVKQAGMQGTGLGLPMVRYIAQAHGGEAFAASTEGKGSIFSFWLPFKK